MEQTMIYDYLGKSDDPLYEQLTNLEKGQKVISGNTEIKMNIFGLYEVESDDIHESFGNLSRCYHYLCNELNMQMVTDVGGT